ncbi:hypothetical protein [Cohnella nanjingensis]|uniref:Uncharacterized protein n=1 Tax=Cohnella nanjingensis TaxID=1387779 RepID=A0A7X0VE06_9BACL|nr:hypothetical protein [Cohnella nanjingensis]MBB6670226.1 hypothetical protein [Cohnella nanjingensis]
MSYSINKFHASSGKTAQPFLLVVLFVPALEVAGNLRHDQLGLFMFLAGDPAQEFLAFLARQNLDLLAVPSDEDFVVLVGRIVEYLFVEAIAFVDVADRITFS